MASLLSVLLHPERRRPGPPPVAVDLRAVMLVGMALWGVALVVSAVLLATGAVGLRAVTTSAAGLVLGALGLVWERRHRSRYRATD